MSAAAVTHWGQTPQAPAVVATSALNGLAFDSHQTWAFWRAQGNGVAESPFRNRKGEPLTMVPVRTLPPKLGGTERLVCLANDTLDGLAAGFANLGKDLRVGVVLALPERLADGNGPENTRARSIIENAVRSWFVRRGTQVAAMVSVARGHASLARAVVEACPPLVEETLDVVLAGGIDSHHDGDVIEALLEQRRVFDGANVDGFIPGEGAAFLLLASGLQATRARVPILARIEGAASADEPGHLGAEVPTQGQGLTAVMRAMAEASARTGRLTEWVLGDVTNEPWRSKEFMLAWARAFAPGGMDDGGRSFTPLGSERMRTDFLPERFGDLGAASMATAAVIACEAFRRGDPEARSALLFGCSTGPARGAVLVGAPARR